MTPMCSPPRRVFALGGEGAVSCRISVFVAEISAHPLGVILGVFCCRNQASRGEASGRQGAKFL